MKRKIENNDFGKRLAHYRKAKGLTQKELGEQIGVSNRVVAYYEKETNFPPAHLIVPMAKALGITTDELLGLKTAKASVEAPNLRIVRRMKAIEALPTAKQKSLLNTIDTFLKGAQK